MTPKDHNKNNIGWIDVFFIVGGFCLGVFLKLSIG